LVFRRRLGADLASRHLYALFTQGVCEVHGGEVAGPQQQRVDPDPHPEVLGAEYLHLGDPVDPRQHVLDTGGGVVGNVELVESAVW
jgi:hypothetical protein